MSALDIAQTLQTSLSGQRFGYFIYKGKQYDVIGQLTRDFRSRPMDVGNLAVRTLGGSGDMVRLDNLIAIRREQLAAGAVSLQPACCRDGVRDARAAGKTMSDGIAAYRAGRARGAR